VTVPHCYPSVVLHSRSFHRVGVGVESRVIVTGEGTRCGGEEWYGGRPYNWDRSDIYSPSNTGTMGSDTVFEPMRGATNSIPLIDFREAMSTRRGDVDAGMVRRSGSRGRGKMGSGSNTRTLELEHCNDDVYDPFTHSC